MDSDFNIHTIYDGQFKVTYRGIPVWKCPFDYVIYQMIICEVKPDLIIEIGTNFGGSSLYMADLLSIVNPSGCIHTIDVVKKFGLEITNNPRISTFVDGWQNYDITQVKKFSKVMVIDDGAHHYQHVLGAWKKFHSLVSVDSYYIIEDGIINDLGLQGYDGGPLRAIKEIFPLDGWMIDRRFCDLFGKNATFNTDGYLKRTR